MRQRRIPRGIALITALLVLAIAVVMAASLAREGALSLRRVENMLHHGQGLAYVQAAEDWARQVLARDARNIDHLGEDWATPLPPIPVEGGEIQGRLYDLQARLNLNALLGPDNQIDPVMRQRLACLLTMAGAEQTEALIDALADWLDADGELRPQGAEDEVYLSRTPPYRTANQPLITSQELLQIQGFTPELVHRLQGLVAALPPDRTLNLYTAAPEVLNCLGEGLPSDAWSSFLEERLRKPPLTKLDDLLGRLGLQGLIDPKGLGVTSSSFLLETQARIGRTHTRRYSVLVRDDQGGVRVLARFQEQP